MPREPSLREDIWDADSLRVSGSIVHGSAVGRTDGYTIRVEVSSHRYEDADGVMTANNIPHIVVINENGEVEAEPHTQWCTSPQTAIDRAKETGREVYENIEEYV